MIVFIKEQTSQEAIQLLVPKLRAAFYERIKYWKLTIQEVRLIKVNLPLIIHLFSHNNLQFKQGVHDGIESIKNEIHQDSELGKK